MRSVEKQSIAPIMFRKPVDAANWVLSLASSTADGKHIQHRAGQNIKPFQSQCLTLLRVDRHADRLLFQFFLMSVCMHQAVSRSALHIHSFSLCLKRLENTMRETLINNDADIYKYYSITQEENVKKAENTNESICPKYDRQTWDGY